MIVLILTLAVFAVVMLIMSVGVMFSGRCLRGSCGGPDILDGSGESLSCATCPKRKARQEGNRPEAARTEAARTEAALPVLQR